MPKVNGTKDKLVVWKYTLPPSNDTIISMPSKAEILSLQVQNGQPCLWVLCDPKSRIVNRRFIILATGQMVDEINIVRTKFVGTFQVNEVGKMLVFHVFDGGEQD